MSRLLAVKVPSVGVMSTRPLIVLHIKVALLTGFLSRGSVVVYEFCGLMKLGE